MDAKHAEGIFDLEMKRLEGSYYAEAVSNSILSPIEKFFNGIIIALKRYIQNINRKIEKAGRDRSYRANLLELKEKLEDAQRRGVKKVEVCDYEYINSYMNKYFGDIKKYSKKFKNVNYKDLKTLYKSLDEFSATIDTNEKELDRVFSKTKVTTPAEALKFVNAELSGRSHVMDGINDAIDAIQELEDAATNLESKAENMGTKLLPEDSGALGGVSQSFKRLGTKIATGAKKATTKFIIAMCILKI